VAAVVRLRLFIVHELFFMPRCDQRSHCIFSHFIFGSMMSSDKPA